MPTVKHFKVIGGEEIIGTVVEGYEHFAEHLVLEKVRALMAQPMGQGQVGLGLVPYMMGNPDGKIKIPLDMIIGDPVEGLPKNLEDTYLQQVSGLTFATSPTAGAGAIQT